LVGVEFARSLIMGRIVKRNVHQRPAIEFLEDRAVPATFGVPWHDASNLTLSFAPDGTPIAGHTSTLFQSMNAQEPAAAWERAVLQAFQTWAVNANINIGLVSDSGDPFGTSGASQHDPRFGDVRVGAQSMAPDALSVSIPNDPSISSTWTGDVLINSNDRFGGNNLDVYSVLLHEAGHVFGIADSTDPNSPMYSQYTGAQRLTSQDVRNLQALYGVRAPDSHEGSSGNDSMNKATQIQPPGSYTGATPLVVYGDVGSNKDVDFYALKPPSNYRGPITFQLQSAGISLLTPHLTVLDAKGNILGDAQATSDFGDVVTVHLNQSDPNATYYLEVRGAAQDVFGIGGYGMAVTFDAANTVSPSTLDTVLRGPYQSLNPNDLSSLLTNPGQVLFNNGHNDGSAVTLAPTPGYALNTHFETVGSIATASDVDLYRIQRPNVPSGQGLVLTATVRSLSPNGTMPRVAILDSNQNPVSAQIIANGDGTFTVQATGLKSSGNFFLRVVPNGSSTSPLGNYALDAEFGATAANLSTFASGSLTASTAQQSYNLYVGESQLMQFVLSAGAVGAPAGATVQMTVTDSTGKVVYSLAAAVGDTVSGPGAFLTPGAYTIHFSLPGVTGGGVPPVSYNLLGEGISDPIGPVPDDPTLIPVYNIPTMPGFFGYPDGTITTDPFLITLMMPPPP
jgi:hypothetical protein